METKGITPSFAEKGAASCSAEFIQSNLLYIEEIFTACNDKLASVEMSGISYSTQCGTIGKMIEDMIALQCYATSAHAQVQESLDGPLFEDFSLNATETISRIKLEDITTDNTFKMEEYTTTVDPSGTLVYQTQVKPSLTMRDFLDIPEEGPVGVPVLKNVETVGEFTSLFQRDYDTMKQREGWDVDTCIEVYMTSGEFDHKMYQPVKTLISNILDMTIVKPFIESLTGTEWITGEDLTDTERDWKMAGAIFDTITMGYGTMVLKGAGYTGKEVAGALVKNAAMDLATNTAVCTVDCIGTELGIPPQIQWILSMTAGCTVSAVGSNFVLSFDDVGGKKVTKELTAEEFQEFFDGEVKKVLKNNPPDLDGLDDSLKKLKQMPSEGGTPTSKPNQVHHYATDKSKTYTQAFKDITDKYGLDLDADWNKDLLPHQGRHPNAYHDFVLDEMRNIDNIANGNKDIFLELYESEIKSIVRDNPDMLYSNYWKGIKE